MASTKLSYNISFQIENMAIDKKELTPANVEPFVIELLDTTPVFEKPMRYNKKLSSFID